MSTPSRNGAVSGASEGLWGGEGVRGGGKDEGKPSGGGDQEGRDGDDGGCHVALTVTRNFGRSGIGVVGVCC